MGKTKTKARKTRDETPKRLLAAISYTKISLVFLAAGFGLLLLFIFNAGEPGTHGIIDKVYFVLLIPFALSTAVFLFKVVGAKAAFKGKVWGGVLELGGSAVVFALILVLGFKLVPDTKPFDFTVILRDARGSSVLKGEGELKIILNNDIRTKKIDENGSVDFKSIPAPFKNKEVPIELDAVGWQFDNGKPSRLCVLKGNHAYLTIERDNSLCCISGTIIDEDGNFVSGAIVTIKGISTKTDEKGRFTLELPSEKQEVEQLLTIQKRGYKTHALIIDSRSQSDVRVSLNKEEIGG
jgi:hypothetical protein